MLKVRLYRPFSIASFVAALPGTVRTLAVLDRTKEPGAVGDPLYLDVVTALIGIRVADARRGRALRDIVEGIHSGDGESDLR